MSNKETEIRNMLEYIADKFYYIQKREEQFRFESPLTIGHESIPRRDSHWYTVDFAKRTISVYSYDESHHNGDHYNCENTELPWETIDNLHGSLTRIVSGLAEQEVMHALKAKLIEERLDQIKKGSH